ncbi:hypothetical protein BC831DRAFT_488735 [Entophlyctis helioformis]|nr:hypothetical protein BC831DRAFT_488735 [Entophlyctis helioformis]
MTRTNRTNTIAVQTHDRSIPRNGRTDTTKKGGAGQGNWGKPGDELTMQEAHDLASSPPKTLSSAALAVNKIQVVSVPPTSTANEAAAAAAHS